MGAPRSCNVDNNINVYRYIDTKYYFLPTHELCMPNGSAEEGGTDQNDPNGGASRAPFRIGSRRDPLGHARDASLH